MHTDAYDSLCPDCACEYITYIKKSNEKKYKNQIKNKAIMNDQAIDVCPIRTQSAQEIKNPIINSKNVEGTMIPTASKKSNQLPLLR